MGNRVGIPAFRQHGYGDDTADIPARRYTLVDPLQVLVIALFFIVVAVELVIVLAHQF
ncbi:hypothetical protein D3C85_1829640 [compost metagenome]